MQQTALFRQSGLFIPLYRLIEYHSNIIFPFVVTMKGEIIMFTKICLWLTIIGGLNWGLVGLLNFNLVSFIFGDMSILSRIVYIVVGLSAAYITYDTIKESVS